MKNTESIMVWDILVRIFHWGLVSAFIIAFVTEEDFLTVHVYAGYIVMSLLLIRSIWGFIGTPYARFSNFVYKPKQVITYLKDILAFRAKRYLGHNPAGGAMIIMLLVSLILTSITGLAVYAAGDNAGPLAIWLGYAGENWAEFFEETHEFFANFTVFLVVIHVAGVLFESMLHHENLISAMFNGRKFLNTK